MFTMFNSFVKEEENNNRGEIAPVEAPVLPIIHPKNEYFRFYQNDKAAAVVVFNDADKVALGQYPSQNAMVRPVVMTEQEKENFVCDYLLSNNLQKTPTKVKRPLIAKTPGGTQIEFRRKIPFRVKNGNGESVTGALLLGSPKRPLMTPGAISRVHQIRSQWNSVEQREIIEPLREGSPHYRKKLKLQEDSQESPTVKGVGFITVDPNAHTKRSPSQQTALGGSAREHMIDALNYLANNRLKYEKEYQAYYPIMLDLLEKYGLEILHAYGHSLCPAEFEPQTATNLGVGPRWINTLMMVLERVAKKAALNSDLKVEINTTFKMLGETEIIEFIKQEIKIIDDESKKEITFSREIEAIQYPSGESHSSTTDAHLVSVVAQNVFENKKPVELYSYQLHQKKGAALSLANTDQSDLHPETTGSSFGLDPRSFFQSVLKAAFASSNA